jgi:hypothetical protein
MPTHNGMGGLQKRLGVFLARHHVLERIVVQLDVDRNGEALAAFRLANTRVDGQLGAARQRLSFRELLGVPGPKSTAASTGSRRPTQGSAHSGSKRCIQGQTAL